MRSEVKIGKVKTWVEENVRENKTDRPKNERLLHGNPDLAGAASNANEK